MLSLTVLVFVKNKSQKNRGLFHIEPQNLQVKTFSRFYFPSVSALKNKSPSNRLSLIFYIPVFNKVVA